jgi:DNA polymerase-3 subunit delta'
MAFKDFPEQQATVQLLQRSLERGRLGHAYLFNGHQLTELEAMATTLAKVLNCLNPVTQNALRIDCCDKCLSCQKIEHGNHADIHWVRPESKSRVITAEQVRDLIKEVQLKPAEAQHKVAVIVAADRLRMEAANVFLKTLEEPPARSILVLLTTDQRRILETIVSRCLRLSFSGAAQRPVPAEQLAWISEFSEMAAAPGKSLLGRYRLLDVLLKKLSEVKGKTDALLTAQSPLERHKDAEKELQDKWDDELKAAIESEYRRQRTDLISLLQSWFRDVWLHTLKSFGKQDHSVKMFNFPELHSTEQLAARLSPGEAIENLDVLEQLQRWLYTNVQEALALEIGLLKLRL